MVDYRKDTGGTGGGITPVASTDNAIVRFNGTNGEVQNSTATISDNGTMVLSNNLVVKPASGSPEGGEIQLHNKVSALAWTADVGANDDFRIFTTTKGNSDVIIGHYTAGTGGITLRTNNAARVKVDSAGNLELPTISTGIILKSANGTRYKITVADDGTLTTTTV